MTTITANRELQDTLAGLKEKTEVRDSSGNILGYFTPRNSKKSFSIGMLTGSSIQKRYDGLQLHNQRVSRSSKSWHI